MRNPDVQEIMRKVRQLKSAQGLEQIQGTQQSLAVDDHVPVETRRLTLSRLPVRNGISFVLNEIQLDELLRPAGLDFVKQTYAKLLRRPPTRDELNRWFLAMQNGMPKVLIVNDLRWSEEGRRINVHVHHLHGSVRLRRLLSRFGKLGDWLYELIRAPRSALILSRTDNELDRRISELESHYAALVQELELSLIGSEVSERNDDTGEMN